MSPPHNPALSPIHHSFDIHEIIAGCEALRREKQNSKRLMYLVIALLVMIMIMFVGIAGITYEVTRALKDTGRNGATMTVKGSDEAIQTANTDMAVSPDGVLSTRPGVGRRSDGSRREGCVNGTCPLVVMAAQLTTEAKLSSSKFSRSVVCPFRRHALQTVCN